MLSAELRICLLPDVVLRGFVVGTLFSLAAFGAVAQSPAAGAGPPKQVVTPQTDIPLEHCDKLPVVKVRVGDRTYQFLVDTAATSMLNLKSFSGGKSKEVHIASWTGTATTSAREVTVAALSLGNHTLTDVKLPAIGQSLIGNACGGAIDGIMGVDLLDQMGVTIDMKRQVASLGGDPPDALQAFGEMEGTMEGCRVAFELGKAAEFEQCLDPEIVLYTAAGEFKGRAEVMKYMQDYYFKFAPDVHYDMTMHEVKLFGNALWYSYDFALDTPEKKVWGHGMSMCRKTDGRWWILNMHDAEVSSEAKVAAKP
ncbi:MAG: DUF4440 domain-containing protein [Candidatus Acidiferrales bacterium]